MAHRSTLRIAGALTALASGLPAQELTQAEKEQLARVKPSATIRFEVTDSPALRVAKATRCIPTPRQLAYQRLEYTCFIHFGPNTFTGVEWGNGKERAAVFHPSQVDTDQWCATAKQAGMTLMLITVKHHDGFCTWQTRYNDKFSVRASPWKNGQGDVLRQLSESCQTHGLRLGVYVSPADLYQIENEDGLYGNSSPYRESSIPTEPGSFHTDPLLGRKPPTGKPTFRFRVDDYNRYMLNQLYEVLTEYGPVHEVWFDGAHPKRKGGQKYAHALWYEMVRALAPEACIAIKGPDVRWCGNEAGKTRRNEWSPVGVRGTPENWRHADMQGEDLGSREVLAKADFVHWYPSEVNTSIRHGWFWRDERQHVKSADQIFDVYERAVGGNGVFLLNVPPNRDGRFSERDVATLLAVGKRIRKTYGQTAATLTKDGSEYRLDSPVAINRCVAREPIATDGQRIEKIALDLRIDGAWQEIAQATTVGYKRIFRFPTATTDRIRLRVLEQRLEARLAEVSVHLDG